MTSLDWMLAVAWGLPVVLGMRAALRVRALQREAAHISTFSFRAGVDPDGRVICGGCGSPVDVAATSSTEQIGVAVLAHMLADPPAHTAMLAALDQAAAHARDQLERDGR